LISETHTGKSGAGTGTVDPGDIARFASQADLWWDPEGPFRPLHRLNPVRLRYIRDRFETAFGCDSRSLTPFRGLSVADVGCGGGLLSEPMARLGAGVTAIDADEAGIAAARRHASESGLSVDYRCMTAESLADQGARFDAVVAMEIVEHVADLGLFLSAIGNLVRPGGVAVLATLNRTAKSYAFAIVAAEYLLRWLPRGTHDWKKFVRPSELARHVRSIGMSVTDISGIAYDPLADEWGISADTAVNYMLTAARADIRG
jgi:2-polyprenyl-6-hydroxyphenyl methylase/3-demethylubiquinone-9 3-methyltransferase